ncbi:anthranilate phosphoribosyltransferase [Granulibacter bethesdensis]|uniref:anthranilate phosphoribosyltransferase n=1 Tax=Granulibacter bethesdensis TaxID=364410 RepID=UPI00090B806B|nr:anthranilate phosphoribosyltransferase [Granulibacter bethesdensis]APH59147.1 Anthranilate phosphoribosyltransferase [Granulibacter bethesdensis]
MTSSPVPAQTDLRPVLSRLAKGEHLNEEEAFAAFDLIMRGQATSSQIAALVMALRLRGETEAEMGGAVRALRSHMIPIKAPDGAIDVCGTGGDGAGTLNISTAVTFVVAGCGVPIAKHGNRALSSRSGAADVLTALGVQIDLGTERQEAILHDEHCAFLFAPHFHPALRHAAEARSQLGIRTLFNLIGPMGNPAGVKRQLTGVFDPIWAAPMARVLGELGTETCWIVHGFGLDELTLAGESQVTALENGSLRQFSVTPEEAGLPRAPLDTIQGGDADHNARVLQALLDGADGPYRDTVCLNAAAALIVAGQTDTLKEGVALARRSIDDGSALSALNRLRAATNAIP